MESTPWDPEGVTVALDPQGRRAEGVAAPGFDPRRCYALMLAARVLDQRLQREGLSHWTPSAGEEAAIVAAVLAAGEDDWIYPGLRDAAVVLARGGDPGTLVRAIANGTRPSALASKIAPVTDALAMHVALAAGHAQALAHLSERAVALVLFGEGATTTGAFHESTMLAVHADVPLVMICKSQLWPEGAPPEAGLVGDSISDRARASGLWVRRVDGADPLGVYVAVAAACERARERRGPGLVEVVVTPRFREAPPHRDPIERLRRHLEATDAWTPAWQRGLEDEHEAALDRVFTELEASAGGGFA